MANVDPEKIKSEVHDFWNQRSCDTYIAGSSKFSREYFEEIETFRYRDQPCIHSFAQFTRMGFPRLPENCNLAGSCLEQAFENLNSGGLPCTVWAEQPETLTGVNLQIQPANSFDSAVVGLAQVTASDHGRHSLILPDISNPQARLVWRGDSLRPRSGQALSVRKHQATSCRGKHLAVRAPAPHGLAPARTNLLLR